ncbi:zinc ABC transporter substrate-binding protein [Thalassococcus sp. CAU 1522]|uniref:High-affinity zinc uptake system protein ZnuA n=1 Tax=Thalassococcus arenae TaxID=2851652 RepID=A0ABS6N8Q5_9RHOB|nr:zinc ABC transporter substrate-binding protein [Thalassococcus arenae]MBV2360398.1 zinc ABC transporter substrate-binding protein [Thalassococcus arenae]
MRVLPVLFCLFALPLKAESPRVMTDLLPVESLVAQVMEGIGAPGRLIEPGGSAHDIALRPSQAQALSEADLVVWLGADLMPGLDRAVSALPADARRLDLSAIAGVTILEPRETAVFEIDADHEDHGHEDHGHDDHGHDEKAHDDHDHAHGAADPHAWLDPDNAALWLSAIAAELAALDPANADTYRANAETGIAAVSAARDEARAALDAAQDKRFVVLHDAYHYYEDAMGLTVIGALSASDDAPPSPARLSELRAHLAEEAVTCLFTEPQANPKLIAALTEGQIVPVAELDPLGAHLEPGPGFYPALIRDLATRIAGCK